MVLITHLQLRNNQILTPQLRCWRPTCRILYYIKFYTIQFRIDCSESANNFTTGAPIFMRSGFTETSFSGVVSLLIYWENRIKNALPRHMRWENGTGNENRTGDTSKQTFGGIDFRAEVIT